jgi:2-phospho-L-lactate guanylyltransferase
MRAVVPYTDRDPKSRLGGLLDADERRDFARAMLHDVLSAVAEAGLEPEVLSTAPVDVGGDVGSQVRVTVDDRPLTPAVNAALDPVGGTETAAAVVMADLALATPTAVRRLVETPGDVAVAPGRGGGTNALVVRHPDFAVDYHGCSYRDHRRVADDVGASVGVVDSMRLSTDVDEPEDLAEVLLHGEGRAAEWLREAGFELAVPGGRVSVERRV